MKPSSKPHILILIVLVSFGTIGGVLFSPALPDLAHFFEISLRQAQLTMTLFLLSYAIGQLPYGPLSNRYGRKPAIGIGCSIALVGALACALSKHFHSFNLLLLGRLIQGLGCAVGLKMAFTIVADFFDPKVGAKINSYLVMSFAIIPGLGTALGGFLTEYLGWQATFYFLFFYGIFVYLLTLRLPETLLEKHPNALKISQIISEYFAKIKNRHILICGSIIGLGTIYTYIFAAKAPFFVIEKLGYHPKVYGIFYLFSLFGTITGSLLSAKLVGKIPPLRMIIFGLCIALVGSLAMFLSLGHGLRHAAALFVPLGIILVGTSTAYANCITYGLSHAKNKSNASAFMSFLNIGLGFMGTMISGIIGSTNPHFTAGVFLSISILACLLWLRLNFIKKIKY